MGCVRWTGGRVAGENEVEPVLRLGSVTVAQAWGGEGSEGSRQVGGSEDVGVAELCDEGVLKGEGKARNGWN